LIKKLSELCVLSVSAVSLFFLTEGGLQLFKSKAFAAISAMLWPIARDAVAPGEGAFKT
jgi:hypothetical protein